MPRPLHRFSGSSVIAHRLNPLPKHAPLRSPFAHSVAGGNRYRRSSGTTRIPPLLCSIPGSSLSARLASLMAETRAPQSLSDIPLDLAGLVLRRLPAHVDRIRFAAVCPQWRVAAREVTLPPPLPLLALPDGTVYSLPRSEPFRLPACEGYTDASGGWLVFSSEDGCFLKDPLSNAIVTLPALSHARVGSAWVTLG
ncbi:hypothetical protein EJB05_26833, partial [Eragrostis curvula]